jgi:hypothetical protein
MKFMHFQCLQDGILVVHESPLICPLLKLTPKISLDDKPSEPEAIHSDKDESPSTGISIGEKLHNNKKFF